MVINWVLSKGFPTETKCYEQTPETVLENFNAKILWDFCMQTNHKLVHNNSVIITVDNETQEYHIMVPQNAACPFDTRGKEKEQ